MNKKVVRFRCIRSNGNASKRHETANGNTGYPSCFRNGFTCFCDVSVYGFLKFRPVGEVKATWPIDKKESKKDALSEARDLGDSSSVAL